MQFLKLRNKNNDNSTTQDYHGEIRYKIVKTEKLLVFPLILFVIATISFIYLTSIINAQVPSNIKHYAEIALLILFLIALIYSIIIFFKTLILIRNNYILIKDDSLEICSGFITKTVICFPYDSIENIIYLTNLFTEKFDIGDIAISGRGNAWYMFKNVKNFKESKYYLEKYKTEFDKGKIK